MNLPPAELERFEERAAKFEYDAGMTRADAERMAMESVMAERRARLEQK